ncbi:39S ribosomal protein L9, mitochondrial [Perca fluviatilis]|uniref:39S ribosomal protein L9, mitochondrial n=1 Tax=Perca fluviatilis TaxID=8168 RepID=UPI00196302E3|nr:39S ribosomal protein L9, mitochondrial [Perca fluviatilis]
MNMWSSGRRVLQDLLSQPAVRSFSRSPTQNTVVVERWWQVPLSKVGNPPRLHPRRHRIYKLVEDIKHAPKEKMELILTQTVPSEYLQCSQQITLGVVVPPHALSLPFESVKDSGDYWCEVTVNGMDTVRIPISLVPYEDPSASYQRQLKTQMQQPQATTDVSEPAAEGEAAEEEVSAAAEGEAAVKAVSDATVDATVALGVSADQDETAASTRMSQDTTAPPSDSPKKDDSK